MPRILAALLVMSLASLTPTLAPAQTQQITLTVTGRAHDGSGTFTLVNRSNDVLAFTTFDGGNVHNAIEHLEGGNWVDVALGYCGMGEDGEVTVAAGARQRVTAYVGSAPGTYRIRLGVERRSASGSRPEEIVSAPFRVR
jgi:hypothetical protein